MDWAVALLPSDWEVVAAAAEAVAEEAVGQELAC